MLEDPDLLRRYVTDRSQDAFAEIVRRRVDLVYSVALRQVGGDAHLAQDVTQKVFADLARKASGLLERPAISGWLYRSAQFAASDIVRSERRRKAREQQTFAMQEITTPEPTPDWERLRPLLDTAMGELNDADRDAVALRFFEGRAFADIGRALQLTEEAARKRVERALDKLAAALSRHGVTSTSAALGVALVGQAAVAAPVGLAATVAGSIGAATGGVVLGNFMSTATLTWGAGAVTALAVGVAVFSVNERRDRTAELSALEQRHGQLEAKLAASEQALRATEQRLAVSEKRAAEADADAGSLLAAIQSSRGAAPTGASSSAIATPIESGPITADTVQARYRRAQELARNGDPAEALRELLWCFDTGMVQVTSFGGVRRSFLLSEVVRLGERYPAALDALRERRDAAEKRLLASETDFDATANFSSINHYLKEPDRTLAVFDQLPADDRRKRTLAMTAFDVLLERQRYPDAALGRTFVQMMQQFDRSAEERPVPASIKDPTALRKAQQSYLVSSTGKHIEVLAGVGQLDQARQLAAKLLAQDGSPETRAKVQTHVERAGQPELLRTLTP